VPQPLTVHRCTNEQLDDICPGNRQLKHSLFCFANSIWPSMEAALNWGHPNRACALPHVRQLSDCWRCCDVIAITVNRWRIVVSGTWKYDDPRLNMSHESAARMWHVQPRVVLFPCPTNNCVSYVLLSDQLQESWIICKLKGKIYCAKNTQFSRTRYHNSKTNCKHNC